MVQHAKKGVHLPRINADIEVEVDARFNAICEIRHQTQRKAEAESRIIKMLLDGGRGDMLTVNWTRLNRAINDKQRKTA